MKLAVEHKPNNINFYKIDGRNAKKFVKLAKKIHGNNLICIWKYDRLEGSGNVKVYVGAKTLLLN